MIDQITILRSKIRSKTGNKNILRLLDNYKIDIFTLRYIYNNLPDANDPKYVEPLVFWKKSKI